MHKAVQRLYKNIIAKQLFKQRINKGLFVKELKVINAFTNTYIFNRYFELVRYPNCHTTFSRAIEFGKRKGVNFGCQ